MTTNAAPFAVQPRATYGEFPREERESETFARSMQVWWENGMYGAVDIQDKCDELYGKDTEPYPQFTTMRKYWMGGGDPLDYTNAYTTLDGQAWHYISMGMTNIHRQLYIRHVGPDANGFGIEFTMRAKKVEGEDVAPIWVVCLMQSLARMAFHYAEAQRRPECVFAPGVSVPWPQSQSCHPRNQDRNLTYLICTLDPELDASTTTRGRVDFVQLVGVTKKEFDTVVIDDYSPDQGMELMSILRTMLRPNLMTDTQRPCLAGTPEFSQLHRKEREAFAVHYAVLENDVRKVGALIAGGARVDTARGSSLDTPLHAAADSGRADVVALLLGAGAPVHGKDSRGRSALIRASAHGHAGVIRALLEHGARSEPEPRSGYTPFLLACRSGKRDAVRAFLDSAINVDVNEASSGGITGLFEATFNGHADIVNLLLEAEGMSVDFSPSGISPLCVACESGNVDIAKALLEKGANPCFPGKNSPLETAACYGHVAVVRLLQSHGVQRDLDRTNDMGNTPLHAAAAEGHAACIKALVDMGAAVDATNQGTTPLMMASGNGYLEAVRALVEANADVSAANDGGETACDLARAQNHNEVADFLATVAARPART